MKQEKMPLYIAGGLSLALVLWMASGLVLKGEEQSQESTAERAEKKLFKVRAVESIGEEIVRETVVHGRTAPDRQVAIRAEVSGTVQEVGAARGSIVEDGELIAALDLRDRSARAAQARAALQQAQLELEAARQLASQGLQSQSQMAAAETALQGARAAVTLTEIDLDRAQVSAPFEGVLAERSVEVGDYLQEGGAVAEILDLDPIIIIGYLTEKEVQDVDVGSQAHAELATGVALEGSIRFIAGTADPQSRMFRVEMEAPNPGSKIRAGVTAKLAVPHESVMAHRISPAHLTLTDNGDIGVLLANEDGVTEFRHVEIAKNTPDGIWVSGLPERAIIVTVGKDFVRPGDKVELVMQKPDAREDAVQEPAAEE